MTPISCQILTNGPTPTALHLLRSISRTTGAAYNHSVRSLVYYVTGHGFGHAVRSAEIIRAIQRRRPELPIHVCSAAPGWLFPPLASHRPVALDVGVVQPDALQTDYDETLRQLGELVGAADQIVTREAAYLTSVQAGLVVA